MARAALDAQEFAAARRALAPLAIAPSQRVAMLMAEIEEREHGDEGRAREWMTRAIRAKADPAWTADGSRSDRWMPVSPVTGRLDAFQWKDPVADLHADEAVIEHDRGPRTVEVPRRRRASIGQASPKHRPMSPSSGRWRRGRSRPPPARVAGYQPIRGLARTAPAAAPIVPLIPVPDDPGPEPQPQLEPETDTSSSANDSWRKLRGLFK